MAKTPELDIRDNYIQNYVINGNFDYWQRDVSFSVATGGAYFCDRFKYGRDGSGDTGTFSRQLFSPGQTDVPGNPTYFARHNQTVAGTGTTVRALEHRIENVSTFAGLKATVSFYMKSDVGRTISANMVQNFGSGGSSLVSVASQNIVLTTAWQKFSLTFTIPSIAGKTVGTGSFISIQWNFPVNAVHTIDMAQVQANEGTEAAPFTLYGRSLIGELVACQRYFEKSYDTDTVVPSATNNGYQVMYGKNAQYFSGPVNYAVAKRFATSNIVFYNPSTNVAGQARGLTGGGSVAISAQGPGTHGFSVFVAVGVEDLYGFQWTADAEL